VAGFSYNYIGLESISAGLFAFFVEVPKLSRPFEGFFSSLEACKVF
jgi:hypothetical protein